MAELEGGPCAPRYEKKLNDYSHDQIAYVQFTARTGKR